VEIGATSSTTEGKKGGGTKHVMLRAKGSGFFRQENSCLNNFFSRSDKKRLSAQLSP